jgi:hypothetical protein
MAVGTLALLLLAGCAPGDGSSTPDPGTPGAAVHQFVTQVNAGDLESARDLYSSETRQIVEDPEIFQSWADQFTHDRTVTDISILESSVAEDTATVQFEIVFEDGSKTSHSVELVSEQGDWKLGPIL